MNQIIHLDHVPSGLREIEEFYGIPAHLNDDGNLVPDLQWQRENMTVIKLNFPLRLAWNKQLTCSNIYCHKKIALALLDALTEIGNYAGADWLKKNDFDLQGGCFATRTQRQADHNISLHAFGAAEDYCPALGPLGEPSKMPWFIVEAFLKRGFTNYPHRDGMHFEASKSY